MEDPAQTQQFPEVLDGRWYAFNEVLLLLEVATETIGTQHLKRAEKHEQGETIDEVAYGRHLGIVL